MSYIPSQDQVKAQLQILIPAIGTAITAFGVSKTDAGTITQVALACIGPLSLVIVGFWTWAANKREALIRRVAQEGTTVILPASEKDLADKLPANVTSAPASTDKGIK